jgi:hypothetical protein
VSTINAALDEIRHALIDAAPADPAELFQRTMLAHLTADGVQTAGHLPLAPYGEPATSYRGHRWIAFTDPRSGVRFAFVGFATSTEPYDTIELVEVHKWTGRPGDVMRLPWAPYSFTLIG